MDYLNVFGELAITFLVKTKLKDMYCDITLAKNWLSPIFLEIQWCILNEIGREPTICSVNLQTAHIIYNLIDAELKVTSLPQAHSTAARWRFQEMRTADFHNTSSENPHPWSSWTNQSPQSEISRNIKFMLVKETHKNPMKLIILYTISLYNLQ